MLRLRRPEVWVAIILFGSYAYFWQTRDWNSASRLMLTYALVDRGTVSLDGMEVQTGDRAWFQGHSYSDKLPGFSLLATLPYAAARTLGGLPAHPLKVPAGIPLWPADYWVTLFTSGLLTALTGSLLARFSTAFGAAPRTSAFVGLAYGLATPAYAYATMSHGHQATAFALLASTWLLWRLPVRHPRWAILGAGFLAAYAAVVELQVGPVSAVLGVYLLAQVAVGVRRPSAVGGFAVGAAIPTLVLLGYNLLAFGSPWEMGYFHHATKIFADVHNEANPLGLGRPNLGLVRPLLWGRYRGLLFYAPIVGLVPFGLVALARSRRWDLALVASAAMAAILTVNLSYPEWTGGWSTGPRLLVPLLPFAMIPVAQLCAERSHWPRSAAWGLGLFGAILMLMFVAVGARIPQFMPDPLLDAVWPIWRGGRVRGWVGEPWARNLAAVVAPGWVGGLSPGGGFLQFAPLVAWQLAMMAAMYVSLVPVPATEPAPASDLRVDEQEHGRRQHEQAEDPGAEAKGMTPDAGPGFVP